MPPLPDPHQLSRRQLFAASASGALLGSAWAVAYHEVASQDDTPATTVVRVGQSLVMLVEYRRNRVLVADCSDPDSLQSLTETVTGFLKQRIDLLLTTSHTLRRLPRQFHGRWNIRQIHTLPDTPGVTGRSAASHPLSIGTLTISCARIPDGEWKRDRPPAQSSWYLAAGYHRSRVVLASSAAAIARVPDQNPGTITCMITGDDGSLPAGMPASVRMIAMPSETELFAQPGRDRTVTAVPLYNGQPVTFQMHADGITLPRLL